MKVGWPTLANLLQLNPRDYPNGGSTSSSYAWFWRQCFEKEVEETLAGAGVEIQETMGNLFLRIGGNLVHIGVAE